MTTLHAQAQDPPPLPQAVKDTISRILPGMLGWCTVEKGIRLAELVWAQRNLVRASEAATAGAPVSVELGVHGGRSLLPQALAWDVVNASPLGWLGLAVGIDAWDYAADAEGTNDPANADWWKTVNHQAVYERCRADLTTHCGTGWLLLRGHSLHAAEHYCHKLRGRIVLLHQDSNHSPEVAIPEIAAWEPLLHPQAYWVMDDADWPSMAPARDEMLRRGWTVREDHTQWLVWQR